MEETLKEAVAALERDRIPYLLGGSLACWVRGGPLPSGDIDLMVRPDDAERAYSALARTGFRMERPPEQWLFKAWSGELLIDLIFRPAGVPLTEDVIARGDELSVAGMRVRVMALEDVLTSKLLALDERSLDYEPLVGIARAVREQVDWREVWTRAEHSPYARGFFTVAEGLGLIPARRAMERRGASIRVAEHAHATD